MTLIRWHGWMRAIRDAEFRKTYGDDNRLIVGNRDNGGLADVNYNWHDNRNDNIGFRVLAVPYAMRNHPPTNFPIS